MKPKIVVLSGAGMSAESGIKTFRDHNGLWENHDVMDVASPEGFARNPELVLRFYNQRRMQLKEVKPNEAHIQIANMESEYDIHIITQNVDDLHERAGSQQITHLHGELVKCRSVKNPNDKLDYDQPITVGDCGADGSQLRPDVVWFGEAVAMMDKAVSIIQDANIVMIIGTSMQVYPAAGLVHYAPTDAHIYYIDPKPSISHELSNRANLHIIAEKATVGVAQAFEMLKMNLEKG